jgi:hypothetical protein
MLLLTFTTSRRGIRSVAMCAGMRPRRNKMVICTLVAPVNPVSCCQSASVWAVEVLFAITWYFLHGHKPCNIIAGITA